MSGLTPEQEQALEIVARGLRAAREFINSPTRGAQRWRDGEHIAASLIPEGLKALDRLRGEVEHGKTTLAAQVEETKRLEKELREARRGAGE